MSTKTEEPFPPTEFLFAEEIGALNGATILVKEDNVKIIIHRPHQVIGTGLSLSEAIRSALEQLAEAEEREQERRDQFDRGIAKIRI